MLSEEKMQILKKELLQSESVASETLRFLLNNEPCKDIYKDITDTQITELLEYTGDNELVTCEDIRRN